MQRYPDWQLRLDAWLRACRRRPFAWGECDCALFAAGGVQAMTGTDPAAAFRDRYRSGDEAARALRDAGHDSLAGAVAAVLPEIAPARAMTGDVALVSGTPGDGPGDVLGIVTGDLICVMTPRGMGVIARTRALRAFRT